MPTHPCARRQSGVALLTVLLVVFLATVAATGLASVQQFAIRRSTLLLHQQQARLYTLGAEQWAEAMLRRDQKDKKVDHLGEEWAAVPPSLPVEGGSLSGHIEDLQGRFNLNNLVKQGAMDQVQIKILQRLLIILELNPDIVQAIIDWIDPNQEPLFPDGAEDSEYVNRTPPYLAANRPLVSVSELRLIKGIDAKSYARLVPYVCVLPEFTAINVNTASAPVLSALVDGLDLARSEALVEARGQDGYTSVNDFLRDAGAEGPAPDTNALTVSSRYFRLDAEASVGDGRAILHSVLERADQGAVRVLLRNFGKDD